MIFYLEDFNGIKRESLQRKEKIKNLIETRSKYNWSDRFNRHSVIKLVRGVEISKKRISLSWKTPASKFYILFQERKKKEKKEEKRNFGKRSKYRRDKNIRRSFLMIFCLKDFRCRLIETLDIIGSIDLMIKLVRGIQIWKKRIS